MPFSSFRRKKFPFAFVPKIARWIITTIRQVPQDACSVVFASVARNQENLSGECVFLRFVLLNNDPFTWRSAFTESPVTVTLADVVRSAIFSQPQIGVEHLLQY